MGSTNECVCVLRTRGCLCNIFYITTMHYMTSISTGPVSRFEVNLCVRDMCDTELVCRPRKCARRCNAHLPHVFRMRYQVAPLSRRIIPPLFDFPTVSDRFARRSHKTCSVGCWKRY